MIAGESHEGGAFRWAAGNRTTLLVMQRPEILRALKGTPRAGMARMQATLPQAIHDVRVWQWDSATIKVGEAAKMHGDFLTP
jgi:hypothetical protein